MFIEYIAPSFKKLNQDTQDELDVLMQTSMASLLYPHLPKVAQLPADALEVILNPHIAYVAGEEG